MHAVRGHLDRARLPRRSPAARSACCSSPTVAFASASGRARREAAVSAGGRRARSAAISRDVVAFSLLSTPFDGRIAICGSGPEADAAVADAGARHTRPPRDERARVDGERGDADEREPTRPQCATAAGARRAAARHRRPSSDASIATFVAYSVCSGAIRSAASRPTPAPYASRARCPRGVVCGSVIMKNRKTRISGEVSSTHQR